MVFAAKALAERMHDGLAASGLACVRVQVQAVWEDGRESTRLWRHDGLLSALAVAERVRWQLAGGPPGGSSCLPAAAPPPTPRAPPTPGRDGTTNDGYPPGGRGGNGQEGGDGNGQEGGDEEVWEGGVRLLRLVPDQLVRDQGRQLGLWGDAVVSDRVARAAIRVQAMLGHDAVTRPVLAGGRSPADQVTLVPFGSTDDRRRRGAGQAGRTGPGRGGFPRRSPATVYQVPLPARITDGSGATVTVSGRGPGLRAARPDVGRRRAVAGGHRLGRPMAGRRTVVGPSAARRRARFQLVTEDGAAWLAAVQDGRWLIEARYD